MTVLEYFTSRLEYYQRILDSEIKSGAPQERIESTKVTITYYQMAIDGLK